MIVLAVFSFSTLAQQVPECKIDPDWKQSKIQETLEACKQSTTAIVPQAVAQDVSAYAEIAKGVAEAIGIAAREVGVAVDEFVKTDTGKMTVALIVWHVAGDCGQDIAAAFGSGRGHGVPSMATQKGPLGT